MILLITMFASLAHADYLGSWRIDDYLTVMANLHKFSTGAEFAADGDVDLWVYEDDGDTQIVDLTMAAFDSITGLYEQKFQLTSGSGFETGKQYTVLIRATVDSVPAHITHTFQINAPVDVNTVAGAAPMSQANVEAYTETGANAALVDEGLDHLVAVAVADEVVNDSIVAKLVSKDATADWSDYIWTTESLEALKDGILNTIDGYLDTEIALLVAEVAEADANFVIALAELAEIDANFVIALAELAEADVNLAIIIADTEAWDTALEAKTIMYGEDANGLTEDDSVSASITSAHKDDIIDRWDANAVPILLPTAVAAGTHTANSFTVSHGWEVNGAYERGTLMIIWDADAATLPIARRLKNWSAGRVITVDKALPFTPAQNDVVKLYANISVKATGP